MNHSGDILSLFQLMSEEDQEDRGQATHPMYRIC